MRSVTIFLNASLLAIFPLLCAAPAQGAGGQALNGHIPDAVAALKPIGRLAGTNRLDLAIGLPWRNGDRLGQLLRQISDPASPSFRHYLTPAQFTEQFGPTEADYQAVIAFAEAHGLKVGGTYPNRMLLDVSGAAADVEQALHVKMRVYQHPTEARTFYAPDSEPSLDLATPVLDVSGLQNYSRPRPQVVAKPLVGGQKVLPNAGSGRGGTYMGQDFRAAYVPDTTMTGAGQTVGLLQFDGYTTSDITYYENLAGLPSVTLSNVLLDGFSGQPTGTGGEVEVSLDIEMSISMAPGLSRVIVYEAGPDGNWHDILNRMANDNLARQLSCSWYDPEVGPDAVAEQIFQQMAAQGQSFFAACGDYDAYTGPFPFPDDSPSIMLVGGTTLTTSGPGGSWVSEKVWNWGNGIGSGGGISTSYPIPSWQTNINMTANQGSLTMRNIPDVAMTADNVYVRADGQDQDVGGTSCASPLWAGFTALVNQRAVMSGRPTVGFINPALDTIGSGQNYTSCFHDITTGNNTSPASPNKFFAVSGYDLCTGWGVPAGQSLINALATPDPLGVQPATGFTAIGGSGGPFTVTSESFVLINSGTNSLNWSLVNTSLWLTVSPPGGTLPGGGSNTTPTVSLGAGAYSLPIGNYTAVVAFSNVTSGIGQTRQFTLQVVPSVPPTIVTQPANQTVFVGFPASFSVTAGGTPPLAYQWQFNTTNINGATNTSLTLTNVSFSEAGSYSVSVTNTYGATNSANAVLTVNPPPPCAPVPSGLISWWPGEGNANDAAGLNNGTLINGASFGPGEVGQAFSFNGQDQYVQIADSPSLRPVSVTLECWFNTSYSSGTGNLMSKPVGAGFYDSYSLWVDSGTLDGGMGNVNGQVPTRYAFNAVAGVWYHAAYTFDNATQMQTLYLNGVAVGSNNTGIATGYDTHPVLIGTELDYGSPVLPFNGRIDEASIYNRALTAAEVASIYAASISGKCPLAPTPPAIVTQPANQSVYEGFTAVFSVTADGTPPLAYQWQFNTTNINGATNTSLTLTNVSYSEAGSYSVTVTNTYGATNSSNAVLTVNPPPPCAPVPSGLISWWPGEGNANDVAGLNNGTLINGASFGPGEVGQAFSFNGKNQYVQIADSPSLRPVSVTLECWFNASNTSGKGNLISKPVGTGINDSYALWVDSGTLDGGMGNVNGQVPTRYAFNAVAGVWYHAAYTFDSDTQMQTLYLNGVAVGSNNTGIAIGYDTHHVFMGTEFDSGSPVLPFNGRIDEASIYNRALTAAEVASIYAASVNGKCPIPPNIVVQPQGQIVGIGGSVTFSVTADGSPPLIYQWSDNGTNIANATNASLTLTNVQITNDGTYAVIVSNVAGSVTSSNAVLAVGFPPAITNQPQSQEVLQGSAVSFSVGATGTGPLDYQWSFGGVPLQQETNSSLTLTNVQAANSGSYRVAVSSPFGAVLSSNAVLTVDLLPVIVTQPASQTVFEGFTAAFSVTASGTPPLAYQWQFNTTNINGATNTSLTLTNVSFSEAGSYSVTVTNTFGATNSSNAVLTVNAPPPCAPVPSGLISWWPGEGNANDAVGLNNGTLVNGASFGPGEVGQAFSFNGGNQYVQIADSPSLRPVSVTLECWFNTSYSSGTGNLMSKPVGTGINDSYALWVDSGTLDGGMGNVNGQVPTRYAFNAVAGVWYHAAYTFDSDTQMQTLYLNGVAVGSNNTGIATGYDTHPVLIGTELDYGSPVLPFNGRIDEASIYNRALTAAEVASIYAASTNGKCPIPMPPSIVIQPQGQSAVVGGSVTFSVIAGGTPPLIYQWSDNGTNIANATNDSLTLTNLHITNAGTYTVIIGNEAGSVTSSNAVLAVGWPPRIKVQPASQSVESNCSATFSVSASGVEPLSYQWWNNGLALSNQTNSSLAITNVQASNFGSYSVVVTNVFGATTSAVAVLALASPPLANPDAVLRFAEGGVRINASDLTANDTVAIYDDLTVIAVSSNSAAGGNVSLNGPWIYYAPPAGGAASDTFTYTVSDGHCGTDMGTVTVQVTTDNPQPLHFAIGRMGDGSLQLTFDGIPGETYHIDYSDSLSPPNWQMLTNQTADGFGVIQITDWPLTNAPARFYRAVWP